MDFGKIFEETMRSVLWFVARFALKILDFAYDTLMDIFTLNLGDFPFIWDWFAGLSILLFFFVLIRLSFMYFKTFYDDEMIEKLDGIGLLRRLTTIAIIMVMIPVMLPGISDITSNLVERFPMIVGFTDTKPSSIVIEAGMADFSDLNKAVIMSDNAKLIDEVTGDKINERNDADEYVYFQSTDNIALVLVLGVICCYCYVFIAIQIAQRIVGMLLKIILAPYSLSGLVDSKDNSTSVWMRMLVSDFVVNFFQMAMLMLSMVASVAVPINGLAKGLFNIGSVFAIMHSPAGISQLLGGDVGASESFNQIQTGMAFGNAVRLGAGVLGSAVSYGSALGVYGSGRALGGRTLNPSKATSVAQNIGIAISGSDSSGVLQNNQSYAHSSLSGGNRTHVQQHNPFSVGSESQKQNRVSSVVNEKGILSYSDGRVVKENSLLDRNRYPGTPSMAGMMGRNMASRMYQKAAEKIYVPKAMKVNTARDRRFAEMMSKYQRPPVNRYPME